MMHLSILSAFILPVLALGAPAGSSPRQAEPCVPTVYTISGFTYTTGAAATNPTVHFEFESAFSNPSIIEDLSTGATCDSTGATLDSFPNETECSSGRANLLYGLRARVDRANFNIIHQWRCNGQAWMSSTPHQITPLSCQTSPDGTTFCESETQKFAPENVRRICSTPTCA